MKLKLKAVRVYSSIKVNRNQENYLIDGDHLDSKNNSQKKYSTLQLHFLSEIACVEIKDTATKYHILVPVTNIAEMILPKEAWDTEAESVKRGPGRPSKVS